MHDLFDQGAPLRFAYGGQVFRGEELGESWQHPDGLLEFTVRTREYPEYNAWEYTAYFKNIGSEPTQLLEDVYAADMDFPCHDPWLKGILGDHDHQYRPYALRPAGIRFTNTRGRATHTWFPYFNLECDGGGWMLAIGWPGTWSAEFSMDNGAVRYRAQGCVGFKACLQPGETVRTPLMAFLRYDYEDRDENIAYNAWRRWMLECNQPTREPIAVSTFAGDTGRPNSDGSISEAHDTWRPTFDKIQSEGLRLDYRWIDAGGTTAPPGRAWTACGPRTTGAARAPSHWTRQSGPGIPCGNVRTICARAAQKR